MKEKDKELVLSQLTKTARLLCELSERAREGRKLLSKNPVHKSDAPDEIKAFMRVSYEKMFDIQLDCVTYVEKAYELYDRYLREVSDHGEEGKAE